jgi:hypothetical protein
VEINESAKEVTRHIDKACREHWRYIAPVFKEAQDGEPKHAGTIFGLNIHGRKILITASHVLEKDERSPSDVKDKIFLAKNGVIEDSLEFKRWNLKLAEGSSVGGEYLDLVALEPIGVEIESLVDGCFTYPKILSRHPKESDYVAALGFPESKNKIKWGTTIATQVGRSFFGKVSQAGICEGLGFPESMHFAYGFDSKKAYLANGQKTNPPKPVGISGGPVVLAHDLDNPFEKIEPKLCGIAIERRREEKCIICVKIGPVVRELMEKVNAG